MHLFYFHLIDDVDVPDNEGKELPDLEAALQHARNQARFTAAETLKTDGTIALSHRIDIQGENGKVLGTVTFGMPSRSGLDQSCMRYINAASGSCRCK